MPDSPKTRRVLILGGTGEAMELARQAADTFAARAEITSSLAGRLRPREDIPGRLHTGGFGGINGLAEYLVAERINMVVDATHPFAANISAHAYAACIRAEVPRLALIRPQWELPTNAKCLELDSIEETAEILPSISRRVFLTIGSSNIEKFSGLDRVWFLVRTIGRQEQSLPLDNFEQITARLPFTVENELGLIEKYDIDTLVSKHSGGEATCAKIAAALDKNIRIVLIRRPLPEPGEAVATVDEALEWLAGRI